MKNKKYDHKKIEGFWQKKWEKAKLFKTEKSCKKPKCYVLDMFPYPSGEGLHVGHPKGYIATDVYSRYKKISGMSVLHPMGWDAFGLPAENYAIKMKIHPEAAVKKNIKRYKEQLQKIGFVYDWDREINTTDPKYYKWTQWIFLKLLEKGLAYESYEPINWCSSCQTGLANEDLDGDVCERCGTKVEKKPMRQWVLKITEYAEKLIKGLEKLPWAENIKELQRNWIGKSEGAELWFNVKSSEEKIRVFTTRPDTLFGVTYLVLAPENKLVDEFKPLIINWTEVEKYRETIKNKTEIERTAVDKDKTGLKLIGVVAKHPVTKEALPVFIADYVLNNYGTGAVMAVPAHDERDFAFAKKHDLPIKQVILPIKNGIDISNANENQSTETLNDGAFTGEGIMINSGVFDGMKSEDAKKKITELVDGKLKVTYKIKDWVFSRQRYWGEPIPVIHCEKCALNDPVGRGIVPVPEKDLPLKLPKVKNYAPSGTGESPLAKIDKWVNVKCPKCKSSAKRETNTMPNWAGSSWYYLRYIDPKNKKILVGEKEEKHWSPVDMYTGGAEHITRHLIYARFWHKFLFDIGVVSYDEPFQKLHTVGLVLAEDGRKMSKRWGNVINPDDIVKTYGADTLRVYEMFMGPFSHAIAWKTENMIGSRRFIEKIWRLQFKVDKKQKPDEKLTSRLHETIKKVSDDIEGFNFNTAISTMMIFANELEAMEKIPLDVYKNFLLLVSPFIPHVADEIWHNIGNKKFIYSESWPKYDAKKIIKNEFNLVLQVNGKVRDTISVEIGISEEKAKEIALSNENIKRNIAGKEIKKVIFVKDRLINFVV